MCPQLDTCAWAGEMGGIGERAKRGEPVGRNVTTTREGTGRTPNSRATTMIGQQFKITKSYGEKKIEWTNWH